MGLAVLAALAAAIVLVDWRALEDVAGREMPAEVAQTLAWKMLVLAVIGPLCMAIALRVFPPEGVVPWIVASVLFSLVGLFSGMAGIAALSLFDRAHLQR